MLDKIRECYLLGKQYAGLTENRFWFGHQMTKDNTEYKFTERYLWDSQIDKIDNYRTRFNLLERLAFEVGDHVETISKAPEFKPKEPQKLRFCVL